MELRTPKKKSTRFPGYDLRLHSNLQRFAANW